VLALLVLGLLRVEPDLRYCCCCCRSKKPPSFSSALDAGEDDGMRLAAHSLEQQQDPAPKHNSGTRRMAQR